MVKKYRREHTVSFAVSLPMKEHLTKAVEKSGLKMSRFIANTIEEKIGPPPEKEEKNETTTEQNPIQE